jgi:hypothetical protein
MIACLILAAAGAAEAGMAPSRMAQDRTIVLSSRSLRVLLSADYPIVAGYEYLPTGLKMDGADSRGTLTINGEPVQWRDWTIRVERNANDVVYAMSLPDRRIAFDVAFILDGSVLTIELRRIQDPDGNFRALGWRFLPLITCHDLEFKFWRLTTGDPDPMAGGKMWMRDLSGQIGESPAQGGPAIRGCLYRADKACVFVDSNYPLFPQQHDLSADHTYRISLNPYRYHVRSVTMPPLKARVVFLRDENGDGVSDLSDYCLWINRHLPDADPLYRTHIWYKVLLQEPTAGVRTTFAQAQEIVRAIRNVTDGLPQLVYLVGWQYTGHDTGYPAMDKVNVGVGGDAGLRALIHECSSSLNTLISYHTNIDDTYRDRPAYDPTVVADNGNISHCLDVESGKVFKRLQAMMGVAPVERTIHFDNMRITSPVATRGIGILEELECGLIPISQYLRSRGITMTTEGQNGIPIDCSGLFQAFWHLDAPVQTAQLWHRHIVGGGWGSHTGPQSRFELGLGSSIHQDVSYQPIDKETLGEDAWKQHFSWMNGPGGLTVSFTKDWDELVDRIYRGTLLYQFYLEREMTKLERVPGGVRQVYGNNEVIVENADNHLKATWGDVTVAEDDDRFIPRGDAVYAYSLQGSERDWILPAQLRGKALVVCTLGKEGRGPAPEFRIQGNAIHLKLAPRTPVKIAAQ